ncbi:MAG: hypothetical protein K0R92_2766 [Lachnospiraceae bacterium]|jgi:hypothetical protein|nr:hypothetical protein [Lachnospiraceae bacterium]
MKSKFPYEEFKTTPIWEVFDKAIQDLASNSDIEVVIAYGLYYRFKYDKEM